MRLQINSRNNLQGEVKFLIGGKVHGPFGRIGAIPIPTVTVRMEEDVFFHVQALVWRAIFMPRIRRKQ